MWVVLLEGAVLMGLCLVPLVTLSLLGTQTLGIISSTASPCSGHCSRAGAPHPHRPHCCGSHLPCSHENMLVSKRGGVFQPPGPRLWLQMNKPPSQGLILEMRRGPCEQFLEAVSQWKTWWGLQGPFNSKWPTQVIQV